MFRTPIFYIFAVMAIVPAAFAQEELDSLDQAIGEVTELGLDTLLRQVQALERENEELKAELETLHKQINDEESDPAFVALQEENEKLRKSLRLMYGGRVENLPDVPMPNRDLLESVLSERQLQERFDERMEHLVTGIDPAAEATGPFTVVKEWGRSPEAVAKMSGNLSTLIGMAVFMTPDTSKDDMIVYAQSLRDQYKDYNNMNIEVFDRLSAAEGFAEKGTIDMAFRVMSISKHEKSGHDVILVGRGEIMEVVK